MCLAMNPDQLEGRQVCASSSNRNFKGRQGSPTGRTLLMSPAMVAAAAIAGEVVDVRDDARGGAGMSHSQIRLSHQPCHRPRAAAARRRSRHRSHHAGALPAGRDVRRPRTAPVRRRPRGRSRASVQRPALYAGASILVVNAQLRLRLVARARAAGPGALRHPRHRRRVVLGDLPGQLGGARHAVLRGRARRSIERCSRWSSTTPETRIDADVDTGVDHGRDAAMQRDAAAGAARCVPQRPVESDGDAARPTSTRFAQVASRLPYVTGFQP